jgi:methyl-accepting chemotaxis protein
MAQNIQASSGNAEMIKSSIDENIKSIGKVAVTAKNQMEMAQKLDKMVRKFKI